MKPNRRRRWGWVALISITLGASLWFWTGRRHNTAQPDSGPQKVSGDLGSKDLPLNFTPGSVSTNSVQEQLQRLATRLKSSSSQQASLRALASLKQVLRGMTKEQASLAIRQFLQTKLDAPTRLGFRIRSDGYLDEAPSLRVFLLDLLGQLDPTAAAAYAGVILNGSDSPDEWALALRNLARGDSSAQGRALLEQKLGELLDREAWQKQPSSGYLEAFDVAVYLGSANSISPLSSLVRKKDNPAVAHAAFLTLDRMVINDAPAILEVLQASPGLMQGREATRAGYFARADVQDPKQRQVLESYLLDLRISATELDHFANLYPNASYMISPNLLTHTGATDGRTLAARDVASLQALQAWSVDPRFVRLKPNLEKAERKVADFVRQANQGR